MGNSQIDISKLKSIKSFGNSMHPLFLDEDIIYFKKKKFSAIKTNDIVVVFKNRKIFAHRVVYPNKKFLITSGDSNKRSDGKIYPKNVLGVVYKAKRNGHYFDPEDIYLIQSSLYFKEILKIKKNLEKEKIRTLFLKGLPLHLYYEGSHPRRIYADCDILVDSKKYPLLKKIFEKQGYVLVDPSMSDIQKGLRGRVTEVGFYKQSHGFPIYWDVHFEIKFTLSHLKSIDNLYPKKLISGLTNHFLENRRQILVKDNGFPVLSHENLFIYLSLHLFRHNYSEIHRLEFIKSILRQRTDFPKIEELSKDFKLNNFIYPVTLLLENYYSYSFPHKFIKSIRPDEGKVRYVEKVMLREDLFSHQERVEEGIKRFKNMLYLSPVNSFIKVRVILNPSLAYSAFSILLKKIRVTF